MVLTLYEGGLSRWGGDSHRRDVDGALASYSDVPLVVRVLWSLKRQLASPRALLGRDGEGPPL